MALGPRPPGPRSSGSRLFGILPFGLRLPGVPVPGLASGRGRKRINRAPSPVVALAMPWLSVMLGSLVAGWITIAATPVVPPIGYLVLIAWSQLRPGLLPAWAGLPLGLFDDLVSGQPLGSAVVLWSVSMLLLEAIEARWPWRNFAIEWSVAALLTGGTLLGGAALASGFATAADWFPVVAIQIGIAVLAYPLAGRIVAVFDALRLARFREID